MLPAGGCNPICQGNGSEAKAEDIKTIKKKGEVIIPSWTLVSTANAVLNTGNVPVFADVDINSRNLTGDEIKKRIDEIAKNQNNFKDKTMDRNYFIIKIINIIYFYKLSNIP